MGKLLWICFTVLRYIYLPHIFPSFFNPPLAINAKKLALSLKYILSVSKNRKQDKNFLSHICKYLKFIHQVLAQVFFKHLKHSFCQFGSTLEIPQL